MDDTAPNLAKMRDDALRNLVDVRVMGAARSGATRAPEMLAGCQHRLDL